MCCVHLIILSVERPFHSRSIKRLAKLESVSIAEEKSDGESAFFFFLSVPVLYALIKIIVKMEVEKKRKIFSAPLDSVPFTCPIKSFRIGSFFF